MAQAILPFEVWKGYLRKDCDGRNKLREFDGLGEYVLRLLWERGLDPTVQVIVDDGASNQQRPLPPKDRMNKEQLRWELRLRKRLEEEADVRMTLLSWLQSEILLIRSQIERINSQNSRPSAIAAERIKKQMQTSQFKHPCSRRTP